MFPPEIVQRVSQAGVVAVLTIDQTANAVPVAQMLLAGGVTAIELTLRTAAATESRRRIRAEVPAMLIGAGTVLNRQQIDDVIAAGAMFGVSQEIRRSIWLYCRSASDGKSQCIAGAHQPRQAAFQLTCFVLTPWVERRSARIDAQLRQFLQWIQ